MFTIYDNSPTDKSKTENQSKDKRQNQIRIAAILGIYVFAVATGVLAWVGLQGRLSESADRRISSYAAIVVQYIDGTGSVGNAAETLSEILAMHYENVTYSISRHDTGEILVKSAEPVPVSPDRFVTLTEALAPGEQITVSERDPGAGRFFLFAALSGSGQYLFTGCVPYQDAIQDMRPIIRVFIIAMLAIVIVSSGTAIVILQLNAKNRRIEEAEEGRREAELANQAKSSFLANMSHEIRTPINAILGMNEMIMRESREKQIKEYARNADTACTSLLSLVNDILDFSKIEAGRLELLLNEYELSSLLNDVYQMIMVKAEQKNLAFDISVDETIPDRLYGDKMRVQQILMNLLSNAVKYTDSGKVDLTVSYSREGEDMLFMKVVVKDTGRGITEENQKNIFDKFQRVDMQTNNTIEGTGLGLSISKTLVEMMGGVISLYSVYGVGSEFTVVIPQKIIDPKPLGNFRERIRDMLYERDIADSSFLAPDAKILVVDDTPMNLEVIKNLLKKTQITVDTCLSGAECLEKLASETYDIIFLDARMPVMDGVETLNRIRSGNLCPPETMIIVLTANVLAGAKQEYLDAGFDEYLPKPVKPIDLEAMLLKFLPIEKVVLDEEMAQEENQPEIPEWLYKNRDLNIDSALELCGSPSVFMDTLRRFAESSLDSIHEIRELLVANDIENFTMKIHAVKSSAKLVGADRLSQIAADLEQAG
ncbi:MAG: response regulator, partial [Lachnospiraceae bacterium]|nr:response regulator [Lachnospiraceae bacterium]